MTRNLTRPLLTRLVPARLRHVWRDALSLLLALADRRTPASARLIGLAALLYTVSPVDLLPDSIPLVGYGDDLLVVPALLAFATRFLPADVLGHARTRADTFAAHRRWLVPAILGAALLLSVLLAVLLVRGAAGLLQN
ncbi:YkvA family protein [Deinococcus aquiradiocola]|uniref:DUF1232 domain-containing protein n=1 Tax=Deinococcus aquiradiocola TaxID=393059 RepID=A0A917PM97_9DEIO|nr:DUF1232 domain-containing protein [Deinococcus aquiradiocola]GGJ83602.1 hypothetical protein GCM10008939_29310 [Deinococcus aquiradiocola]